MDETQLSIPKNNIKLKKNDKYQIKKKKINIKNRINIKNKFSSNIKINKNLIPKNNNNIPINDLLKESNYCIKEGKKLINYKQNILINKNGYQNLNHYFREIIEDKCKLKKNFKDISITTYNQLKCNKREKINDNFQKKINKLSKQHNSLIDFIELEKYNNLYDFILLNDYYNSLNNNKNIKNIINKNSSMKNKENKINIKNKLFNIIKKNNNKIKIDNILYMKKKIWNINKINESSNYNQNDNFNKEFFVSMKNKYYKLIGAKIHKKNFNVKNLLDNNIKKKEKEIDEINKIIKNDKSKKLLKNKESDIKLNKFIKNNCNLVDSTKGFNFKNYAKSDLDSFFKVLKAKILNEKLKNPNINLTSVSKLL